eukprot:TRINITY_DN7443_c0_g1_i1.p1 TRINITY_DN7443_c0_g1~~TRINITY_DN7443_c0_g1_i1.p1  ORF type:complete len:333 (-),score=100.83 TRINITY_DN7443_c0_g1_i1:46-1044(-)
METSSPPTVVASNTTSAATWRASVVSWFIVVLLFWYVCSVLIRKAFGGKIIGITGGIASGKSTFVNRMMSIAPIPVIDFDLISRDVSAPGCDGWVNLRKIFPVELFDPVTGELLREEMGKLVFLNAGERNRLNGALRTPMRNLFLWELYGVFFVRRQRTAFVVAPLLFEQGLHRICSTTICVVVDAEEEQLKRLAARDKLPIEQVRARVASQMPTSQKRAMANHVVLNNGGIEELSAQADAFLVTQGDLFEVVHEEGDQHSPQEEEKLVGGGQAGGERHSHLDWYGKPDTWIQSLRPNLVSMLGAAVVTSAVFGVYFGVMLWANLCSNTLLV